MAASFPTSVKTFSTLVDLVDSVLASHQNDRGDEITAIENYLIESATEVTVSSGTLTVTKSRHKVQPQSGTADDIDTISGMPDGGTLILRASDAGTDTLTLKHGTGNLSCFGAADVALSTGFAMCWRNGSTVYVSGGGGGSSTYGDLFPHDGVVLNGKISVSVASNNLTVALKTLAGADPSSSDPVYVRINNTIRTCSAALSVTKNAGTNWFNSGGSEIATKEVDYFVYLLWNTTPGTDIVDLGFARIPHGRVYSDFSGTTTNEKYLAFANASTPTSTDDCVNIGRFAATLSAGAGYTWTVPTFTNTNLIQHPIFITRWLDFSPQWSGSGSMTVTSVTETRKKYQVSYDNCWIDVVVSAFTIGGTPSSLIYMTLPFSSLVTTFPILAGGVPITDAGGGDMGYLRNDSTATRAAWAKRTSGNYTAGAGTFLGGRGSYAI